MKYPTHTHHVHYYSSTCHCEGCSRTRSQKELERMRQKYRSDYENEYKNAQDDYNQALRDLNAKVEWMYEECENDADSDELDHQQIGYHLSYCREALQYKQMRAEDCAYATYQKKLKALNDYKN